MAKSREEIQDKALRDMERNLRKYDKSGKKDTEPTLEEQLREERRIQKMTSEQRLAAMPFHLWLNNLKNHISYERKICAGRSFDSICDLNKEEIKKFHEAGTHYSKLVKYFEKKFMEFLNR